MTFVRDVAEGVHVITRAHTNMFLVEAGGGLLLVDTGLPSFWPDIEAGVARLGYGRDDVSGVIITHGHFDHVGCARRLRDQWGVPILVSARDRYLAAHPYSYAHERNRPAYVLSHPGGLPILASMGAAGAFGVRGVDGTQDPGDLPPLPSDVELIATPGHTEGHVVVHLPERRVILTGDALVTRDPYTGGTGPQIVAGAATADSLTALASLAPLVDTQADTVLPGHGGPWRNGIASAVDAAIGRGAH